jgi:protein-S-isoprenylcysteine O-methyltransferase Ste14
MRFLFLLYGVTCYLIAFATILYFIGFVGNFVVPKSMDSGTSGPLLEAIFINLLLISMFAIQHSVMARKGFKKAWAKIIPPAIERNTYVLFSSLALILLFWQWRPMGDVVWDVSGTNLGHVLIAISLLGWLIVLISTFLLDHFEFLGLKHAMANVHGHELPKGQFRTPGLYKLVRHPLYLGFTIAFWATPIMTTAHLLFAVCTLGYTVIGMLLEEQDLTAEFGEEYKVYKSKVSMLLPLKFGGHSSTTTQKETTKL